MKKSKLSCNGLECLSPQRAVAVVVVVVVNQQEVRAICKG